MTERAIAAVSFVPDPPAAAAPQPLGWRGAVPGRFAGDVMETFAARVLTVLLGIASTILVARFLGPEGRGIFAVAITVGAIGVQVGNLGLHAANTYYLARDRSLLPSLLGNSILAGVGLGLVTAVAFGIGLVWIFGGAGLHGWILLLALVWIPLGLVYTLTQGLLLGLKDIRGYNASELAGKCLGLALLGALAVIGSRSVATWLAAGVLGLGLSAGWVLFRASSALTASSRTSLGLFREMLHYGGRAYLAAFFAFLVLRVDLLMVERLVGAEGAGHYSIAVTMADMVYIFPVVLGSILFPTLAALPDRAAKRAGLMRAIWQVLAVVVPLSLIAALLAWPATELLFGAQFAPAVPAFVWLLPGIVMLSVSTTMMNYFAAVGMPLVTVYLPLLAAVLNVLLNLALLPVFGILGASLASVAAYGLLMCGSMLYLALDR